MTTGIVHRWFNDQANNAAHRVCADPECALEMTLMGAAEEQSAAAPGNNSEWSKS